MPSAMLKACPGGGGTCAELVASGLCAVHQRAADARRGSAHSRGYTYHWSHVVRPRFFRLLIAADVVPVCGAALPGGPNMRDSQCRADGILNASHLHVDHDPSLREWERQDRRAVENPLRCGLLCESFHNARTAKQMNAGMV